MDGCSNNTSGFCLHKICTNLFVVIAVVFGCARNRSKKPISTVCTVCKTHEGHWLNDWNTHICCAHFWWHCTLSALFWTFIECVAIIVCANQNKGDPKMVVRAFVAYTSVHPSHRSISIRSFQSFSGYENSVNYIYEMRTCVCVW